MNDKEKDCEMPSGKNTVIEIMNNSCRRVYYDFIKMAYGQTQ